jgi:hypothetical protein
MALNTSIRRRGTQATAFLDRLPEPAESVRLDSTQKYDFIYRINKTYMK